jgi:prepilin-type N-terminal cleavage/methylation domain-containing protein
MERRPIATLMVSRQRGFSLMEVMAAAMVLSVFILGIGACWIVADRAVNAAVVREKAMFVANAEMHRVTALYVGTSFGVSGPVVTTGYSLPSGAPSTRLIYPTSLSSYISGGSNNYIATSSASFLSGAEEQVWVDAQFLPAQNRSYVWIDRNRNLLGRVSWATSNIIPSACVSGGGTCWCVGFSGGGAAQCRKLDLYLEYPYRLSGGSAVADPSVQTVSISTIVGRTR